MKFCGGESPPSIEYVKGQGSRAESSASSAPSALINYKASLSINTEREG